MRASRSADWLRLWMFALNRVPARAICKSARSETNVDASRPGARRPSHVPTCSRPMLHLRSTRRPAAFAALARSALCLSISACTMIPAAAPDRTHAEALADLRAMLRDVGAAQVQWHAEHASFATPAVLLARDPSAL